jgi:LemA protein
MTKRIWIWIIVAVAIALVTYLGLCLYYFSAQKNAAQVEWGELDFAYRQRANIIPGLLGTTRNVAIYDGKDWNALRTALAEVNGLTPPRGGEVIDHQPSFDAYAVAQRDLTSAIYALIAVVDRDPQLKFDQGYVDIKKQLAISSSSIELAKRRYEADAKAFNQSRASFPDDVFAKMLGEQFNVNGRFAEHAGGKKRQPAS